MPALATILAAINAASVAAPGVLALINELKTAFGASDQAQIDAAVAAANAQADAQHDAAQKF